LKPLLSRTSIPVLTGSKTAVADWPAQEQKTNAATDIENILVKTFLINDYFLP
jgi:hypothetical protein